MKELRLDFPDYPAAEQEKDAERAARRKETEIYVMKVNGAWGGYMPRANYSMTFNTKRGVELPEFIQTLKEELAEINIKPRFRCIENQGVADHIKQQQFILKGQSNGRD